MFSKEKKSASGIQWENEYLRSAMGRKFWSFLNVGRFREWKISLFKNFNAVIRELFYNKKEKKKPIKFT